MNTDRPILITGAAGFIGSHLAQRLCRDGREVVGLDNLDEFYDPALKHKNLAAVEAVAHGRFRFVKGDIRDSDAVTGLYREYKPGATVHLAARGGVRPSILDPALYASVNIEGSTVMMEAARKAIPEAPFLLASSSSVYGNNEKVPFAETDPVEMPISPYAATKRSCELVAATYHQLYDMPIACLRFFNAFGPRQRPDLAFSKFLRMVAAGEQIPFYGDGTTSRDYTFIDDMLEGVVAAMERIHQFGYRIWNLGSDRPVTLSTVVETVSEVVGREAVIDRMPVPPGDVRQTYADLTRSRDELGYEPKIPFSDALARQYASIQQETDVAAGVG
ncbi:MAG: GDP-mannose 4,6-dehydratase [Planctomycetota bacterium]